MSGTSKFLGEKSTQVLINQIKNKCTQKINEFPKASAEEVGNTYQYNGVSNKDFVHNYFYECVGENGVYTWKQVNIQPASNITTESWENLNSNVSDMKQEINDIWKVQGKVGTKNLLEYPYNSDSLTTQGVTFVVNDDGSVDASGTTESVSVEFPIFTLTGKQLLLKAGTYIFSDGLPNGSAAFTNLLIRDSLNSWNSVLSRMGNLETPFEITDEMASKIASGEYRIQIKLCVRANKTVDATYYPMIRYAEDTDTTWQPYVPTNKELANKLNQISKDGTSYDDTEIKAEINDIWKAQGKLGAKNLLAYPYDDTFPKIGNGITYTTNNDGTLIVNGTSTNWANARLMLKTFAQSKLIISTEQLLPEGVHIVVDKIVDTKHVRLFTIGNNKDKEKEFILENNINLYVGIDIQPNVTLDNYEIKVMLRYASDTDDTWQPYVPTNRELNKRINDVADDDTEIKAEINDIWKVQGKLGAKNLLPFPYAENNKVRSGVTWAANGDGSINASGVITGETYSYIQCNTANISLDLKAGQYIASIISSIPTMHFDVRLTNWSGVNFIHLGIAYNDKPATFTVTQEMIDAIKNGTSSIYSIVEVNKLTDEFSDVAFPMIRYASDTDDTWQPYAPTNRQLAEQIKNISNVNNIRTPIAIHATKTKTKYQQGETINLDDLKVQVSFDNGTTEETSHYTTNIDTLNTFTAGLKQLVVSYYDNGVKVSDTVNLKVSFDESYDKVQYAYKIANAGAIRPQTTILGLNSKLYKYSQMQLKLKLHLIIEQNNNANPTNITIENSAFVKNTTFGKVTIPAYEVGEYDIVVDMPFEYNNSTVEPPMDLIYLKSDGGAYVNGMFENRGYSLALISEFQLAPVTIEPSKVTKYFVTNEDVEYSDVTAIVTFNDDSTQTFNADELIIGKKNIDNTQVGDQKLVVGYAQNGKQVNANVNLHFFAHDKTEPDEFVDMTADEWYNSWKYGINFGNCFDPYGTGYLASGYFPDSLEGDRFLDGSKCQETHWFQPKITQQNVQELVDAGFEMVRIPITWYVNSYITKEYLGTFDADGNEEFITHYHVGKWFLYRIREVVDWCLDAGLKVLINTHHDSKQIFDLGVNDTLLEKKCQIARDWWTEIAEKFKYHNQNLAFEGFNEIDNLKLGWTPSVDAQLQMNQLNQAFVDAVRSTGANNLHRVLVCPFLIHRVTKMLSDVFVVPHDIGDVNSDISNYIGTAVHWYPKDHTQGIDVLMSQIEGFRTQLSIPIMINEYGLQIDHSLDERKKYYVNYINRAKQHNVKTVIWDNGTDFNVVKKHNASGKGASSMTFEESQSLCKAIAQGYDTNTAYALPSNQVYVYENIDNIVSGEFNSDGTIHSATWTNFVTKDFIPCKIGQTISILCNRVSEHSARKKLCVGIIAFYDADYNFIRSTVLGSSKSQITEATVVNEDAAFFKVQFFCASGTPTLKSLDELDEYMFSKGDSCIISVYQDKDEQEVTLQDRVPYSIKSINVLDNGVCDSQGNWTKEPKYVLDIAYDNGATHILYYSGSRLNVGQARLVIPNIDTSTSSSYECAIEYTYNGITLTYPNTGIMVQTGSYLNSIEKVTLPTTTTFDISKYTKEQIINKLKEEIEVIGHYSDNTTKVIDDYVLNVDSVAFSEMGTYHVYISVPALNYNTTFDIQIVDSTFNADQYHMLAVASKQQLTDWVNNSAASSKVKESWLNTLANEFVISLNDGRVIASSGKLVYDATNDKYYYNTGDQYSAGLYQRYYFIEFTNSELLSSINAANTSKPSTVVNVKTSNNFVVDNQNRLWVILNEVSSFKDENGNFVGVKNTAYNIRKVNNIDELSAIEL